MNFAIRRKYNYSDLYLISDNLGLLYKDGISITKSLELLLELPLSKEYKNSISKIHMKVNSGESLSEAFSYYENIYPKFFIGLLSVGENSGKLSKVLKSLSNYYEKINKTKKEVLNALVYPGILIISLIVVLVILILFIVPTFFEIYNSMGKEIPKSSEVLYKINDSIRTNPFGSLVSIICWGILVPYMLIKAFWPMINEKIICKQRIFKSTIEYVLVLLLSIVASSGINLQIGLRYCIDSVNIKVVKKSLLKIYNDILVGRELSTSIKEIEYFSNYTISIIKLGEESGSMDERLMRLETRISEKSLVVLKRFLALIQPTIILGMAIVVGIFIIIFIAPLFDTMYSGVM